MVFSNTTPFIALASIDCLSLLPELFDSCRSVAPGAIGGAHRAPAPACQWIIRVEKLQPPTQTTMTYTGTTLALSNGRIFEETLPLLATAGKGINQCA